MSNSDWYAAKTIYRHSIIEDGTPKTVFEERVVVFQATGFDDAIAKAEEEASTYCANVGDVIFLNFVDAFRLADGTIGHGAEIYSLMRDSDLTDRDYLNQFYDTGRERRSED